ncbi:hypothetical protein E4U28_005564 [Claviceps purpurea]|nr:hypothetical protein E4U28_005564 [Claviceps purpurea]
MATIKPGRTDSSRVWLITDDRIARCNPVLGTRSPYFRALGSTGASHKWIKAHRLRCQCHSGISSGIPHTYAYATKVLVVTLPLGSRILLVSKSTFDSIKLGVKGVALQLAMDYQKANHESMKIEYS